MATALAAGRLQPWPQLQHEVVHGLGSAGVSVRAFGGYPAKAVGTSHSRGRICRVPPFRTSSSTRREALSEDHDITDMQELADGSLFFSFGPGSDSKAARPAKATTTKSAKASSSSSPPQSKAQSEANSTSRNLKALPPRHPSSFRKHSPIPAAHKKASELKTTAKAATSPAGAAENKKPERKEKVRSSNKAAAAAEPQRPPSSFFKRSPIPKDRVPAPASKKKIQATETPSTNSTATASAKDSPFSPELKEILSGKEGAKSVKTPSAGVPAKKKVLKVVVKEETVVEVAPTSSGGGAAAATTKKTSNAATESEEPAAEKASEKAAVKAGEKGADKGAEKGAENGAVSEDLGSYKLPELRSLAKARGLKGYSKLKKGELVDLLAGLES